MKLVDPETRWVYTAHFQHLIIRPKRVALQDEALGVVLVALRNVPDGDRARWIVQNYRRQLLDRSEQRRVTVCRFHRGPCLGAPSACEDGAVRTARYNPIDEHRGLPFKRWLGREKAFGRALRDVVRERGTRERLWMEYRMVENADPRRRGTR